MKLSTMCELCGNEATYHLCGECHKLVSENAEYYRTEVIDEFSKAWDILFPNEKDGWDYPGQMYRCVLTEMMARNEALNEAVQMLQMVHGYFVLLTRGDAALLDGTIDHMDRAVLGMVTELNLRLVAKAGDAQTPERLEALYPTLEA